MGMQGEDERMPVKKSAHVCKVEGVGELEEVASACTEVELGCVQLLGAVIVVLLGKNRKRSRRDGRVRVTDAAFGEGK